MTRDGAAVANRAAEAVEAADLGSIRTADGRIDVKRLASLAPRVEELDRSVQQALTSLADADSPWIVPTVRDRAVDLRDELVEAGERVRDARVAVTALPALLGVDGPRRYLLVVPTPSEARASGGLIGSFGEIEASDGRLRLTRFGRTIELLEQGVPGPQRVLSGPADYLARYGRFQVSQLWQNVNLTPDFPTAGAVMGELYPQSGGRPIDGVISVDPYALAGILELTGPITLAAWPEPITSASAPRILLHEFYARLGATENQLRIDLQAEVAQEAWRRFLEQPLPSPSALIGALGPAVQGRHLQMWASRPVEQDLVRLLGMDGSFAPPTGDAFAAVSNNAGANKIDWFLHRDVGYRATVDLSTGAVRATAQISLRNDAPAEGLPRYVIGNQAEPPAPAGTNVQYLSLYSPLRFTEVRVDGSPVTAELGTELGRNVASVWIRIPPGGRVTVEASLEGVVPVANGRYELAIDCQPQVNPDGGGVVIETVAAAAGATTLSPGLTRRDDGAAEFRGALACGSRWWSRRARRWRARRCRARRRPADRRGSRRRAGGCGRRRQGDA